MSQNLHPSFLGAQACTLKTSSGKFLKFFQFFSDSIISILLDSGATHSFIAKHIISKYSLPSCLIPEQLPLFNLSSHSSPSQWITHKTSWAVKIPNFPTFKWDFLIIDSPDTEDIILGYDFLSTFNPVIDWVEGTIHPRKDIIHPSVVSQFSSVLDNHSDPIPSSSSSFLPDLCTKSDPSSFHNSVHSSQHISFPSISLFKAEVFEDQDQDVDKARLDSLPIEHQIMNPSPLNLNSQGISYSWQDFKDEEEEEEIETVKKVVPSHYHAYLDVFSKVKAD